MPAMKKSAESSYFPEGRSPELSKLGEVIDFRFARLAAAQGLSLPRSPRETRDAVREALSAEHALDDAEILVEVQNGVLLLKGCVPEARLRALAADCAVEVPEVRVIRNEIRVRPDLNRLN